MEKERRKDGAVRTGRERGGMQQRGLARLARARRPTQERGAESSEGINGGKDREATKSVDKKDEKMEAKKPNEPFECA